MVEIWHCFSCYSSFKKPDMNTIIDEKGKEHSYPMCTSCDGWNITKIEYENDEEYFKKLRRLGL